MNRGFALLPLLVTIAALALLSTGTFAYYQIQSEPELQPAESPVALEFVEVEPEVLVESPTPTAQPTIEATEEVIVTFNEEVNTPRATSPAIPAPKKAATLQPAVQGTQSTNDSSSEVHVLLSEEPNNPAPSSSNDPAPAQEANNQSSAEEPQPEASDEPAFDPNVDYDGEENSDSEDNSDVEIVVEIIP